MIRTPTVLVLGAGASMEYGFPSGERLRQQIVEGLSTESQDPQSRYRLI